MLGRGIATLCAASLAACLAGSDVAGSRIDDGGEDGNVTQPIQDSQDGSDGGDGNDATDANRPPQVVGPAEVDAAGDGNFTAAKPWQTDPNLAATKAGVPSGSWQTFYVPGANSNYYTGKAPGVSPQVTINRQVQVFVADQLDKTAEAPLLVLMDGGDFRYTLEHTLPNLIASGALPPLVAVTVSAGSQAGTNNERSFEYDAVSTRWGDYLEAEIYPLVEQKAGVKLSQNPALRGTMGGSSGGAAALTLAWLRPDRYGRVLTFSGSFVNLWPTSDYPKGAWAYANGEIAQAERKNLRITLSAGSGDISAGNGGERDWLLANRRVADALADKGYHYRYVYIPGGGHEEPDALRQIIPTELAWAWRGWALSAASSN